MLRPRVRISFNAFNEVDVAPKPKDVRVPCTGRNKSGPSVTFYLVILKLKYVSRLCHGVLLRHCTLLVTEIKEFYSEMLRRDGRAGSFFCRFASAKLGPK